MPGNDSFKILRREVQSKSLDNLGFLGVLFAIA